MVLALIWIVVGLLGLYFGGEFLVKGAAQLASSFGVSSLIIGLTVVAWSTSAPELVVSVNAAFQGVPDIALGNVLGSNIANIGLILGITALIALVPVSKQLLQREIPFLLIVTVLSYLLALNGDLDRFDGILLLLGFIFFSWLLYYFIKKEQKNIVEEVEHFVEEETLDGKQKKPVKRWFEIVRVLLGLVLLVIGANFTVDGATTIAKAFGVSDMIIGLTLVAVGTSLPELAATLVAALHKHTDIAVGNIVGSNIANLLMILGVTSTIHPISIASNTLFMEFPVMALFALLLLLLAWNQKIGRLKAAFLLSCYVLSIGFLLFKW